MFANTGQTFRSFWTDGFDGERPTTEDWKMHLATLFPETRLKTTLEMRSVDSQPMSTYCALAALWAGLLYDPRALDEAEALVTPFTHDMLVRARADIAIRGIGAELGEQPVRELAERVLEVSSGGLRRRARLDGSGQDECRHLDSVITLVSRGQSPGSVLLERLNGSLERADILEASRADG